MPLRSRLGKLLRKGPAKDFGQPNNGDLKQAIVAPPKSAAKLPAARADGEFQPPGQAAPSTAAPSAQPAASMTPPPPTPASLPVTTDIVTHNPALPEQHKKDACDEPGLPPTTVEAPGQASAARDLWREAFEKLPKQTQQGLSVGDSVIKPYLQQIDELVVATKVRQEECEQKFWKFRAGNHEVVLRDLTVKIVGCLQQIGDVAVQFAPPQASVPWAAIRMIMQTSVIESAQMCALLASVDRLVRIVNRGQVYELVYTIDSTPKLAFENLQSALMELYGACLELLSNSSKLFSKGTAERTVHAILHPGDTEDLFSKLVELETRLGNEVLACESGRSAAADAVQTDLLRKLDAPLTRVDEGVSTLLERVDDAERIKMLKWISPVLFGKHHDEVKESRTSGTCKWLLQHENFREWEENSSSVILWLQGSPGTGKTFLASMVIDHVQTSLESSPNHEGFAFFYCNRNESGRCEPLSVLQSYVRQLSTVASNHEQMQVKLRRLCKDAEEKGFDLSFDKCKKQLLESVNIYPKTTLVLDALDECEPESRGRLVDTIEFLLSNSKRPLKVFISSRPDRDIRHRFLNRPNVEIQARHNEEDIRKFVDEEIIEYGRWREVSPLLKEDIVTILLNNGQGMFQWVSMQIKQILDLETESAIRDRLGKLPSGLKATYDEIYVKIQSRNPYDKAIANRAFILVMCACTPLSSKELLSAIRLDQDEDTISLSDAISESQLLHLCNNLLVIDSQQEVWRFSHLSVTEYFEENHFDLWQAHCHAAKVCLKLLIETYKNQPQSSNETEVDSSGDEHDQEKEPRDIFNLKHPVQMYIRHHWMIHVQNQEGKKTNYILARLLKTFMGSPSESSVQYRGWYRQVVSDGWRKPSTSAFSDIEVEDISPETYAILAICRFKIYTSLLDWWDDAEIEISQTNTRGDNLLALAAVAGCAPISERLMARGMQVNMPFETGRHGSALGAAVYGGNTKLVELLVKKGADINMVLQAGEYGSALAVAANWGQTETFEFLVEQGADINAILQTGDCGSVLVAAVRREQTKIVQFLVEHGVDVNLSLQSGRYGSVLVAAVSAGHIETVKFLVEKGAHVNMLLQFGDYGSALAAAGRSWTFGTIVEFLIEKGADVNMPLQTGDYGNALEAASFSDGYVADIVNLLVEHGADVNMLSQRGEYGSALAAAAACGEDTEIIESLIRNEADVNMPLLTGIYGSALAAAACRDYDEDGIEAVECLLDNKADVNMLLQTGQFGSALAAAAVHGCFEIVELFINYGADVNMVLQAGDYGSALAAAVVHNEDTSIIEFLVSKGADVNMALQTGGYGSALAAAVLRDKPVIIDFLVKNGADINTGLQTGDYGSVLAAAANQGMTKTIKFLVDHRADVNMALRTGGYGSALAAAVLGDTLVIIDFLVKNGADINIGLQTGDYGSVLAAAANQGMTKTVEFLVEHGADVNMALQTGVYGSALAAAVLGNELEIVDFLVKNGADVNTGLQTGNYGSALAAGAGRGRTNITKYLLEAGADANQRLQVGRRGTALAAAAYWGWDDCAKALIEAGAEVNLKLENGSFSTALQASRADVSQEDQDGVWWDDRDNESRKRGKDAVAELLLRHGATNIHKTSRGSSYHRR